MAIARGAGTEILRSAHGEATGATDRMMIQGVQHHIYTVLSVICTMVGQNAAGDFARMFLVGYDTNGGDTDQMIMIFQEDFPGTQSTFVWNEKFSFNGYEPADFTGPMDSIVKQDAIADQAGSVAQDLWIDCEHSNDTLDWTCTFLDQNNA